MSKVIKYILWKKSSIIVLPFNRKACFVLSFIGEIQTRHCPPRTKCVVCVRQLSAVAQSTVFLQVFFVIINNHNHNHNNSHNHNPNHNSE